MRGPPGDKSILVSERRGFHAISAADFCQYVADVVPGCSLRDEQVRCNFLVRPAPGDQPQDVNLAAREGGNGTGGAGSVFQESF
jgi:hypothetical protein